MKKKKINFRVIIGAIVVVSIVAFLIWRNQAQKKILPYLSYNILEEDELINSVNLKGVVESVSSKNIYGYSNLKITSVNFEVGDKVKKGEPLINLDTEELNLTIQQQKSELSKAQESNLNQLENNQRILNEAKNNLNSGLNQQITSAESSVKSSKITLETAQKNYDDKLKEIEENDNSQVVSAQNSLDNTKIEIDNLKEKIEKNKILYNSGVISESEYNQLVQNLETLENQYDTGLSNLNMAKSGLEKELVTLKNNLESAQINHSNSLSSEMSAETSASQEINRYTSNVESSQIATSTDSQLISIQKLEKQLGDSTVVAPINGTITAVYAKEGSLSNGLLFIVEDTENLKIKTKVKEYDIEKIQEGMDVVIKTDATEDKEFSGVIEKKAPTSLKSETGIASSSDVEFETEVKVLSEKTDLKIGMNTRLNVILEKEDKAFYVPFDAIKENPNGEFSVYEILEEEGKYFTKEIPITIGMETDFYIQIKGDLKSNQKIINDSSLVVSEKMEVTIIEPSVFNLPMQGVVN